MISIIVPARSQRQETRDCLDSILTSVRLLNLEDACEYILLDDNSDPSHDLVGLFKTFRQATARPVRIVRFKERQHYSRIFAQGLSRATGQNVFFISNDMVVTPWWMRTLLAVAALDPTFGVIRGTAEYVDSHPEHQFVPPFEARSRQDWFDFSQMMSQSLGLAHSVDGILSGDAVLIRRPLLDKIGVVDRRFPSYFGDLDFGLRAQRAGFKLVCAKGAWLRHHGAGYIRAEVAARSTTLEAIMPERMAAVQEAYARFREKWDLSMPERYPGGTGSFDFAKLRATTKPKGFDHSPPLPDDPAIAENL